MSEQVRISELVLDLLKDLAIAYGIAALAVPYLRGCNHVGSLASPVAYMATGIFSVVLSSVSIYRCVSGISRKFGQLPTVVRIGVSLLWIGLAIANGIGMLLVTDNSFHPVTHIGLGDRIENFFLDRMQFAQQCPR